MTVTLNNNYNSHNNNNTVYFGGYAGTEGNNITIKFYGTNANTATAFGAAFFLITD